MNMNEVSLLFFSLYLTGLCHARGRHCVESPVTALYWTVFVIEGRSWMAYVAAVLFSFHTCEVRRIKLIVSGPVASSKLFFEWCAVVC